MRSIYFVQSNLKRNDLISKKKCYDNFIFDSLNILGSTDSIDRRRGDLLEVILPLPWKYVLVLRNATANLKIDNRSNFDRIFCSKGSREAKWSSSPFRRSLWRLEGLLLAWLELSLLGVGLKLKNEICVY